MKQKFFRNETVLLRTSAKEREDLNKIIEIKR